MHDTRPSTWTKAGTCGKAWGHWISGARLRLKHRAPRTVLLIPKWQTSRDEEGGTGPTMRIMTLVPPCNGPVLGLIARSVMTANWKSKPTPVYCC